ncbi:Uma2 family endonuclease [Streptomyces sp. SID3343]|uniref:Uma2 family endonuclease n=1 Tax=Streptomyces sp. SID3343 TaxID=2690260 RepID=UPI00136983FA|nr:Uma2 family endonuclease [Streptomyces sp. SID3343]MYW03979.1 Uma2 family endonuclease [Streptomyces sp. SID3343]
MTALAQEAPAASPSEILFAHPTRFIAAIPVPKGIRVEYIEEIYHVTPPANEEHNYWASEIYHQLRLAGVDLAVIGTGYCAEPAGSKHVTGAFIPDFVIQHRRSDEADQAYRTAHDGWYPASMVRLAGEVTSPGNASIDREGKYRTYARAGIPIYVLIDREKRSAIAYSDPVDRGKDSYYRVADRVKLGEKLPLPDGLPTLDTDALT